MHDLTTGDMTWRELRTFVRHLPQDSAFGRSVLGDAADWQVAEHLLAVLINKFTHANSSKRPPKDQLIHPPEPRTQEPQTNGHKPLGAKDLDKLFGG